MRVVISLHKDRTSLGRLEVFDDAGAVLLGPVDCFAKADSKAAGLHGNPERNPVLPFGDTPTGEYKIPRLVSHNGSESDVHTYGTYPSVLLDPVNGDALSARRNGRSGLMIHGGVPSTNGKLRPTHGCIRVTENSQRDLVAIVVGSTLATSSVSIHET